MEKRRAHKGLGLTNIDGSMENRALEAVWALTEEEKTQLENSGMATSIERVDLSYRRGRLEMFPNAYLPEFNAWDPDTLRSYHLALPGYDHRTDTPQHALYRRAISTYEGHDRNRRR